MIISYWSDANVNGAAPGLPPLQVNPRKRVPVLPSPPWSANTIGTAAILRAHRLGLLQPRRIPMMP
jgi:hypothetical protein